MSDRGKHTYAEILSQSEVWSETIAAFWPEAPALEALWQEHRFARVIFTGCGSTHYLSMTGAALCQALTGIPAAAYPASELVLFPDMVFTPKTKTLLVAVSRSGTTTETVAAVKAFQQHGGAPCVVITCDGDTPLGRLANVCLTAPAQEQSIAQTRSFTSMTVLAQTLAAQLSGHDARILDRLSAILRRLFESYHDLARAFGEDTGIERFFFLGSGFLHGIANEAMLKMKEMSLSYSEAFHFLEFRHGPMSMVDERSLVVGLLSEPAQAQELAVLDQMQHYGAQILPIVEAAGPPKSVRLESGLPDWARPVLYLPILQLMAYYRAMARGQNPDRPAKLDAVVSLDIDTLK